MRYLESICAPGQASRRRLRRYWWRPRSREDAGHLRADPIRPTKAGEIPSLRIGRAVRYSVEDLRTWSRKTTARTGDSGPNIE